MKISGVNRFTLVNYPGKLACVLFAKGCPLHCKYCYNKILLSEPDIDWEDIKEFLEQRQGKLEAVVFSGGEPMAQYQELNAAVDFCKSLGFSIGLHLTGLNSDKEEFREIVNKSNWIGLDFKAPEKKYKEICGLSFADFKRALDIIIDSKINFEIRTTLDNRLSKEDLLEMDNFLQENNIEKWYLQKLMLREGIFEIPEFNLNIFKTLVEIR